MGDDKGDVAYLWERECSVQRRFQKLALVYTVNLNLNLIDNEYAQMAPSTITRNIVRLLLAASMKMTWASRYQDVGTFEYLVKSHTGEWVFFEINPRIQVEHIVTGALHQPVPKLPISQLN